MGEDPPRTLLVLKPSSFGDIIHTLPAVARLKAAWPDCRIAWLANQEWVPLLEGNPALAEIIPFPRQEFRGWGGGWRMVQWLRSGAVSRRSDLALDFQGLLRTAVIGRASGARVLAGLSDAREGATLLYHRTVASPRQPVHAITRYLALAGAAIGKPEVNDDQSAYGGVSELLPAGSPTSLPFEFEHGFVLIHPYSRGGGKSLTKENIREFIRQFIKAKIVLVGHAESPVAGEIPGCLNLLGRTSIHELIWLTRRASFVVSVDSGPAHLAAALGRPMVSIHAWSDPRRVGPYRQDAWVWKNGRLVQVRDLPGMEPSFFEPKPLDLRAEDVAAIAALATSP